MNKIVRENGLCVSCKNLRLVKNKRGSTFIFCTLSKEDLRFRKYPHQPVFQCEGYDHVN